LPLEPAQAVLLDEILPVLRDKGLAAGDDARVHEAPRDAIVVENGPLANMAEFAAAFSCPAGVSMVRPADERCRVW
jgi:hypothetical protein